jgi:hypothetical protein
MGNCTRCNRYTEYQDGPYLCYLCKNPPFAATPVAEPVEQKAPEPKAGFIHHTGNPWTLAKVRMALKPWARRSPGVPVTNPPCKLCKAALVDHRCGQDAAGQKGYYDDPNAWACPKSIDGITVNWESQQWYVPDYS